MSKEIEKIAEFILPIKEGKTWVTWNIALEMAKGISNAGYCRHEQTDREIKLAQALEPNGVRTPSSDLFRELADPEFRYHYINADKKTQGEINASMKQTDLRKAVGKILSGLVHTIKTEHYDFHHDAKLDALDQILSLIHPELKVKS